jgi:3-phosphoshikimate 1-carboxyvinyltransferase
MTDFLAIPPAREMAGELRVPPSKSGTNRALLAAVLSGEPLEIAGPLESDDTAALRSCLAAMGATITESPGGWTVRGPLRASPGGSSAATALDAADSGTAARFLAAAAAVLPGRFSLDGSARLRERPMGELVDALRTAGARITYVGREGYLPLAIEGGGLESATVTVDASRSSQFVSALLLGALAVDGGLRVRAAGEVASASYVGMTVETLRALGHEVAEEADGIAVRRGSRPARRYDVPGDYSSAVPLLSALTVAGGRIRLLGLRWPSADADARALPVLATMGLEIEGSPETVEGAARGGRLRPVTVRATDFPDAVPALAAAAAFAEGSSRFEGVGHLRLKESDRLAALVELLSAAGAHAAAAGDALVVTGPASPPTRPTRLRTHRDHRMAMAAGILALRLPGLLVEDPGCVSKSYAGFFRDLQRLTIR